MFTYLWWRRYLEPGRQNNRGTSFLRDFERSGDLKDVNNAIAHHENAVRLARDGHPERPNCLAHLGLSLFSRFERSGDLMDINNAISHQEHAVRLTPDGHASKPGYLNSLANSFLRRFERSGDLMDIENGISHHKHAVSLTPDGHVNKPVYLDNLGNSFARWFERSGDLMHIDNAVSHHGRAVRLTPDGHADMPKYLNDLGCSLDRRSQHSRTPVDLDNAIFHLEHALRLTPDGHVDKPDHLNNLGVSSLFLAKHGDLMGIDRVISHHEQAVRLIPDDHAKKPVYLQNLGNSYLRRFERSGDPMNIADAITHYKHALSLTPDDHCDLPVHLMNLGNAYMRQFQRFKDQTDIDQAISHHQRAVQLSPDGHASKINLLGNLAKSLLCRSKHPLVAHSTDLPQAILSFKCCATSPGDPFLAFLAALWWARLSHEIHDPEGSLLGYKTVLSLFPGVAWLGQFPSVRYRNLANIGSFVSIATEAAAVALAYEQPHIALEWLEQGRSIVWGQLLSLRTPVDNLREVNPNLADDLVWTSRALENASSHDTTSNELGAPLSLEDAAQNHRRLAEKWENLLTSARMLPGFEDFLLPKKLSTLSQAAEFGPVVVINVHKSQSDALILQSGRDDVIHLPLGGPEFYGKVQFLPLLLKLQLEAAGFRVRDARAARMVPVIFNSSIFEKILAFLWVGVVEPVLNKLAFNTSTTSKLPRIWWCPTGPLTFLPIHAAGLYGQFSPGPNVSDFAVSSYTPTVTALLEARRETPTEYNGLLGVSQSDTPGETRLLNADRELDLIMQFDSSLNIHSLPGELATVDRVLEAMEETSWVHLACHAVQDRSPTQSNFRLYNGGLTLSKIITKSFRNADFAFLSACQTATGDKNLPEEAVHLAAGMLAAGYRSVIATMWSIRDDDAPLIAGEVYPRLVHGPAPDSAMAARALHHAVKRLREQLEETESPDRAYLSWVPFIHVGK